jgi:Uma2 family endonuclease
MSQSHKILPHYTYDDWVHWEGSWELIEGFPIAMSPTPVPSHQRVAAALRAELSFLLKKCNNCSVYDPLDYRLADDTILIPDILVVCGEIKKKYLDFPPILVAEVLSPSTALRDRHTKYSYYEQEGVKYYLIVDADSKKVEIFVLVNGKYLLQELSDKGTYPFIFDENCEGDVNLGEIW